MRQLRFAHNEMLNTVIFNRPLTRPSHRPDPFPDMTLEQIARVPYDDAVKARFAQDDELRKKILDEYRK